MAATISHRALVMDETRRIDGIAILRASTEGGYADLTSDDARRVGLELLRWADEQDGATDQPAEVFGS